MDWWRKLRRLVPGTSGFGAPTATADYYLLGGIRDLVAEGAPTPARPVVRLGANTWAHDDRLVIIRYLTEEEAEIVERWRWRSVHYVIDDLMPAASNSVELPAGYRARLAAFAGRMLPRILALSPVIIAPSAPILDAFAGFERLRLDPCCLALVDGPLPRPTPFSGRLEIAFLGTRSHLGSLPLLADVAQLLDRDGRDARLHLFFGRHLPREIAALRTVVNHEPIAWPGFASFCRQSKFHIALAPVQPTTFATARSITKLMDHAAVGAAGIYGDRPPFKGVVAHGRDGLLAGDDPSEWADMIRGLAQDPDGMAHMAAKGSELAAKLGDPMRVRRFWIEALAIDGAIA